MDLPNPLQDIRFTNRLALSDVQVTRPATTSRYLSTTLILKAMIDCGVIAARPNALYMLQEGIQWFYHLHPDGIITSADPTILSCFRSPNSTAVELVARSMQYFPKFVQPLHGLYV
jgi:hypothetical protein